MNATIVEVKGPDVRVGDSFTGKRYDYGNFVKVREDNNTEHIFINGSINQVAPENRVIGLCGTIVWHRTVSYNLPFFYPSPKILPEILDNPSRLM